MLLQIFAGLATLVYIGGFAFFIITFPCPGETFSDPEHDAKMAAHKAYMAKMDQAIRAEMIKGIEAQLELTAELRRLSKLL